MFRCWPGDLCECFCIDLENTMITLGITESLRNQITLASTLMAPLFAPEKVVYEEQGRNHLCWNSVHCFAAVAIFLFFNLYFKNAISSNITTH